MYCSDERTRVALSTVSGCKTVGTNPLRLFTYDSVGYACERALISVTNLFSRVIEKYDQADGEDSGSEVTGDCFHVGHTKLMKSNEGDMYPKELRDEGCEGDMDLRFAVTRKSIALLKKGVRPTIRRC